MTKPVIAILTPMTSRGQSWIELHECAFLTTFLPSLLRTWELDKFQYRFYLGIDDDDAFFQRHRKALEARLRPDDKVLSFDGYTGNPCGIWTELMKTAHADGADYFSQWGDDIRIESNGWTSYLVSILKANGDTGVVGGAEEHYWITRLGAGQVGILENAMVSRDHYDKLGFFFPPELKNWFSDDWLTAIYGNKTFLCPNIHFSNTNRVGDHNDLSRYKPEKGDETVWKKYAVRDAAKLA